MRNGTKTEARPRGRPRQFDSDTVLRAASECFRTSGFEGTSLDDLAAATGLNRPSLYAAFGGKRALYIAVLERTYARLVRAFDSMEDMDLTPRQVLELVFRYTIDGYVTGANAAGGCLAVTTAALTGLEDELVRTSFARFLALEDHRIAGLLAKAGDTNADAHARIAASVIHSLSTRVRAGATREELEQVAQDCIEVLAPA